MSKSAFSPGRRQFLRASGLFALSGLGGCAFDRWEPEGNAASSAAGGYAFLRPQIGVDAAVTRPDVMYAAIDEGPFHLPAIPYDKIPRPFRRQIVPNTTGEAPGTIIVNTREHFLYFTLPGADAIRYGVGVGRAGFEWSGRANVRYKREWPRWTPPPEMIARQPELMKYRNGMEPGVTNPLGARALYIFKNGVDTGYRIHGSPEWWSIGQSMSSGCIRLVNQDIIDLYNRVPVGAPIVVL